jgi:ribonuclease HI
MVEVGRHAVAEWWRRPHGGGNNESVDMPVVHVYCDGACSPNPGWGGWGALLISPAHEVTRELSGAEPNTTNNRMELIGAISALQALKTPCQVVLHTDSQYVRNAFAKGWIPKWQKNGWLTSARKPVLNQDLWQELVRLSGIHTVEWVWVKGHAFNELHNRCDALAVEAREALAKSAKATR